MAKFGDVGEDGYAHGVRELPVLRERRERLRKNHVGARFHVSARALERRLLPFDRVRIGARHDDELRIGACIDGGADAIHHLGGGDELFAGAMAAAFSAHLILKVHTAGTGFAEIGRGARDIERRPPAGVGIHQKRQGGGRGNAPRILADVAARGDAEVGHAEGGVSDSGAGEVEGLEPAALGEQGRVGIHGADDLQRSLGLDGCAQPCSGGG